MQWRQVDKALGSTAPDDGVWVSTYRAPTYSRVKVDKHVHSTDTERPRSVGERTVRIPRI